MFSPWKESYGKPRQHIKKQRHHFTNKVHIVKPMFFPVVTYRCESWTVKKTESWRTDPSKLWFWRRFLRVPWTVWRSNQSILKEINPEYSLEGLMLKLKFQYFGHLFWRTDSLERILMVGKITSKRGKQQQRMRCLDSITDSMHVNLSKLGDSGGERSLCAAVHGVTKSQARLIN